MDNQVIEKDIQAIIEAGGNDNDVLNYLKSNNISYNQKEESTAEKPLQSQEQPQQQNILQQLVQAISQAPNTILRGTAEPFIKSFGSAGLGINDMLSKLTGGQQVPEYDVPFPGGDIPVRRMEGVPQAVGLGLQGGAMAMGVNPTLAGAVYGGGQAMAEQKQPLEVAGQTALGGLIGKGISLATGKPLISPGVKKILKFDNALKQAEKSKIALDTVRTGLGQAKQIALEEVKDVPVNFDWSNVPEKVVTAIKKPEYGITFTPEGQVVNTIGNLDKVKMALQDIPTTKDFVEAGNMAKRQIMQFAGKVRDSMVNAADDLGKPELAKALKDYHNFMENYNLINDKLVDKYGNAMANKLKATFKWQAEPAVKEAWKEVSKASPEIKSVMKSMNKREMLGNLLKYSGYGALATGTVGGLSHFIKKD